MFAEVRTPVACSAWELSADGANAVRRILARGGLPSGHIYVVAGKADTDHITRIRQAPPIPTNFTA